MAAEMIQMDEVDKFTHANQAVIIYKRTGGLSKPDYAYLTAGSAFGCGMSSQAEAARVARRVIDDGGWLEKAIRED